MRVLPMALAVLFLAPAAGAQTPGTPGVFGLSISVQGEDGYVWTTPIAAGNPQGTIEMWIKSESTAPAVFWVGGRGHPGVTGDHAFLGVPLGHGQSDKMSFGMYIGLACCWYLARSDDAPELGQWYHVAGTWGPEGMQIFIDGVLIRTYPRTDAMRVYQMDVIGSSSWGGGLIGAIDDLRFWSVQRTEAEIQSTMSRPLTPTEYSAPEVLAYYPFDHFEDLGINGDGADDFRDVSTYEHHADAEGNVTLIDATVPVLDSSWGVLKARYENQE